MKVNRYKNNITEWIFETNKESFLRYFKEIERDNNKVMIVMIQSPDLTDYEYIINTTDNMDAKLAYYEKAYNDKLELNTFNKIKIVGYTYSNLYMETGDNFKKVGR